MSLLLESIKLSDGVFCNLHHHEQRMRRSLQHLFGFSGAVKLEDFLKGTKYPSQGLFKCRIVYDAVDRKVEFTPYKPKEIRTLKIVEADDISYEYKLRNREHLDRLTALSQACDDILIVKKGFVTDSSFANIAFKREEQWFTPDTPLLNGTQRQKLIDSNKLIPLEIKAKDIRSFDTFKLINAMLEFDGPEIPVNHIHF